MRLGVIARPCAPNLLPSSAVARRCTCTNTCPSDSMAFFGTAVRQYGYLLSTCQMPDRKSFALFRGASPPSRNPRQSGAPFHSSQTSSNQPTPPPTLPTLAETTARLFGLPLPRPVSSLHLSSDLLPIAPSLSPFAFAAPVARIASRPDQTRPDRHDTTAPLKSIRARLGNRDTN